MNVHNQPIEFRCAEIVRRLPIPRPFTLDHFLRLLSDRRGKVIALVPVAVGATGPCGLLVGSDEVDYICYAQNTSPLHQRHIILHEIGHLELGHEADWVGLSRNPAGERRGDELEVLAKLMPHLSAGMIRRLLGRTAPVTDQEADAELFATLAGARINRMAGERNLVPRDLEMQRLRSVFDVHAGRADA